MVKTVGIIGLGQAGRKICINLARHGHSVLILDLNKDLYKDLPENCSPVENAKEMAQKVKIRIYVKKNSHVILTNISLQSNLVNPPILGFLFRFSL